MIRHLAFLCVLVLTGLAAAHADEASGKAAATLFPREAFLEEYADSLLLAKPQMKQQFEAGGLNITEGAFDVLFANWAAQMEAQVYSRFEAELARYLAENFSGEEIETIVDEGEAFPFGSLSEKLKAHQMPITRISFETGYLLGQETMVAVIERIRAGETLEGADAAITGELARLFALR